MVASAIAAPTAGRRESSVTSAKFVTLKVALKSVTPNQEASFANRKASAFQGRSSKRRLSIKIQHFGSII